MDEKKIAIRRAQAIRYALNWGLKLEDAEDFAQRHLIKRYINKSIQNFEYGIIDYMRHAFGDSRSKHKQDRERGINEYLEVHSGEPVEKPDEVLHRKQTREINLDELSRRQKRVLYLSLKLQGGHEAIAKKMGVSPSRISQMLREIKELLEINLP